MSGITTAISVSELGKCFTGRVDYKSTLREKIYQQIGLRKASAPSAKSFWALRHVNFEIKKGEVVGIIGSNGAGKSTLLKLLAQVIEPTEGRMEFRGKVVSILEIGTGFHPDLNGIENIYLSGSLLQMSKQEIDQKLKDIVAFSELGEFLYRQVKYYSSGMFLRLAFSVCTHLDAEILLLDEVVSVGDAAFSVKSLQRIREIAAQGKTIVLASHDLASVQNICARCILLEKGTLLDVGETGELVERYIEKGVYKSLFEKNRTMDEAHELPVNGVSYLMAHREFAEGEKKSSGISLNYARVFSSGRSDGFLEMKDSIVIECSFRKEVVGIMAVSFIINYNMQANLMSVAHFNSYAGAGEDFLDIGKYVVKCKFPATFFNHGIFSASLFITDEGGNVLLQEDNLLIFKIRMSKISSGKLSYDGKYSGGLYPKSEWEFCKK